MKPHRIAIDARWIFPEISGIGAYTRELIAALCELDKHNAYTLLFRDPAVMERTRAETRFDLAENVSAEILPWGAFSPRSQFLLPRRLRKGRIQVFHSTNYMIPLLAFPRSRTGDTACVVTIHDVIPMIFPHHAPRSRKARLYPCYRRLMTEVGQRADRIVTDSHASQLDIIKHLRIPDNAAGKVRVVPCGVAERFSPGAAPQPGSRADAGRERRLLYVGRSDPYKNLSLLIRALAAVRAACSAPARLVVAGALDTRYPEPRRLAVSLGVADAVTWTGYVTEEALVSLYRESDILVHPSRYEGFGLQVLEAMACGLPVVSSNAGALREVTGDAAVLLDPDDVNGFAAAILNVLQNPETAAGMRRKGLQRARQYSWARTAGAILAIYEEAAVSALRRGPAGG